MAKRKDDESASRSIKLPPRGILTVTMVGTRPLVLNQFPQRERDAIYARDTGENRRGAKVKKDRDPKLEYEQAATKIETPRGARVAWPARAWLRQLSEAAIALNVEKKTASKAGVNRMLEVEGGLPEFPEWCVIEPKDEHSGPALREDMCRNAGMTGAPRLSWRVEFLPGWRTTIRIHIANLNLYPPSLVLVLLKTAGFLGIGEGCIKPGKKPMGWGKADIAEDPKPSLVKLALEEMGYEEA